MRIGKHIRFQEADVYAFILSRTEAPEPIAELTPTRSRRRA